MKVLVTVALVLLFNGNNNDRLLRLFLSAANDENASLELVRITEPVTESSSARWMAYRGAALIMRCPHFFNPYQKLKHFSQGREWLEKAIARDHHAAELRLLRYAIQSQSPSFLGYSQNISEDRIFLEEFLNRGSCPAELATAIRQCFKATPQ